MKGVELKMTTLTPKQNAILNYIKEYTSKHGYAPSYREIAHHFKLKSTSTVHKHMQALISKEKIKKKYNSKRSVEFINTSHNSGVIELPMLGFIAAGKPIEAIQIEENIQLPENMINGKEAYVLKVKGDSMIEEHIQDGDFVIVEKRNHANNGEMVVALINDNETTLKRIFYEGGKIKLQPANAMLSPIIVEPENIKIQGVVIGLLRKYK
jgi:repressor LexA